MKKETRLKGIIASSGIAIGKVFILEREGDLLIPVHKIPKENVKKEIARYKQSLEKTKQELSSTKERILKSLGKSHVDLVDAYIKLLDDRLFTHDIIRMIEEEQCSAEFSVSSSLNKVIQMFARSGDDYFRGRMVDMKDVGQKLLRNLLEKKRKSLKKVTSQHIVVAATLDPHDVIILKEQNCAGFVLEVGTKTSHVALAAQGLGIVSIVGLKDITNQEIEDEDDIIIDGFQGFVILHPTQETLQEYKKQYESLIREKDELIYLKKSKSETRDHHKIDLLCNIDLPKEVDKVIESSAEGIGLFRTEYQYTDRNSLPTEDELYKDYNFVAQKVYPHPVVIRTFDIGADKLSQLGLEGVVKEKVPSLGLRGVRLALKYPEIFKTQIKAILRASQKGNVKIMFPMVTKAEEIDEIKKIIQEVKHELKEQKVGFDENIPVGVMIETPSAALTCDVVIKKVDFVSLGTNDLIQYTLAVDRFNENVADLYDPLHLSVLRLIKNVVDIAHSKNKTVSICGEMAADPMFTKILIGLGIDELSVPPSVVLKIKKIVCTTNFYEAKELSEEILRCESNQAMIDILKQEK
jgi:phosphotransferase system enzyme I (PtsI)